MPRSLGPDGLLRITEGSYTYLLPLMQSATIDRPAGTTEDRTYVNPKLNPPRSRTTPGGPGSFSATFDRNASAAVLALRRIKAIDATAKFEWITNPVDVLVNGSGSNTLAIAAPTGGKPSIMTGVGVDFTGTDWDSGTFIVLEGIVYVIDTVLTTTTAYVFRVGTVTGGVVTPDTKPTDPGAVPAKNTWTLVVPADVSEFNATVSQIGGSSISQTSQDDTVVLNLTQTAKELFWVTENLNPDTGM